MPQITTVRSIAELKGLNPTNAPFVWVKSYYDDPLLPGKYVGGGGMLRWDTTMPLPTPDDGIVFASSLMEFENVGRWVRDQVVDALDFGADPTFDYSTMTGPDSADRLRAYFDWAVLNKQEVIIPKGIFYISELTTPLFHITDRITISGSSMLNTILVINPALTSGDVMLIDDTWRRGILGLANASEYASNANQGVTICDMSIISKQNTLTLQNPLINGIDTRGRVDELRIHNIQFSWLGTALSLGLIENEDSNAAVRESSFSNLYCMHCGAASMPAIDIRTAFEGDGTNSFFVDQCGVVYPEGIGINIENQDVSTDADGGAEKIRRLRFVNLMLHGSAPMANPPQVPLVRLIGNVEDVEMIGVGMDGSTAGNTLQGCVELVAFTSGVSTEFPSQIQILGDVRSCNGVGLDVVRANAVLAYLTGDQASMGATGSNPMARFSASSVGDNQTACVRALAAYANGANVEIEGTVLDSVLAERSSGGITGGHTQKVGTNVTVGYNNETIVVKTGMARTITLPKLSETPPGRQLYVVDGQGLAGQATKNITIVPAVDTPANTIEGLAEVKITTNWGKRAFRCIEVGGSKTWLTWLL